MSFSNDWSPKRKITFKAESYRGIFPTNKSTYDYVEFESSIERDWTFIWDHAPDVIIFIHQPHTIKFEINQDTPKYTYDQKLKVENFEKEILVEIKSEKDLKDNFENEYRNKFKAGLIFAEKNNTVFVILTDKIVKQSARLINIMFTKAASRVFENEFYLDDIVDILINFVGIEFNNLCIKLANSLGISLNKASQIICYHIYHGNLFVPTFSTHFLNGRTKIYEHQGNSSPFKPVLQEYAILEQYERWKNILEADTQEIKLLQSDDISNSKESITEMYNLPPKYESLIEFKLDIIENWISFSKKSKPNYQQFIDKYLNKWEQFLEKDNPTQITKLSVRTIKRWTKSYQQDGIIGLAPKYDRSGKYRYKSSTKYSGDMMEIFHQARLYYLRKRASVTLENAYDYYLEKLAVAFENGDLPIQEPMKKEVFKVYVYRYSTEEEKSRGYYDRSTHDSMYGRVYGEKLNALMPLHIYEVDNSQSDQYIKDQEYEEELPPPHLTAAIDTYTGMIPGYYLSLDHPSHSSAIETLIQSIMNKGDTCNDLGVHPSLWPIEGIPLMLKLDNARDFTATNLVRFAVKNSIIIEYARLGKGKDKPHVEQFFRRVWDASKNNKGGGYRPPFNLRIQNRDYKVTKNLTFDFFEWESWFTDWLLNTYHLKTKMNGMKAAPLKKYYDTYHHTNGIILPEPTPAPNLTTQKGIFDNNTKMKKFSNIIKEYSLSKDGINRLDLEYQSPGLISLFKKRSKRGRSVKVRVLIDRRDIRKITVIDPDEEQYYDGFVRGNVWDEVNRVLPNYLRGMPISLNLWKQMRDLIKVNNRDFDYNKLKEEFDRRDRVMDKVSKGIKSAVKRSKGMRKEIERAKINREILSNTTEEILSSNHQELMEYYEEDEDDKVELEVDLDDEDEFDDGELDLPDELLPTYDTE